VVGTTVAARAPAFLPRADLDRLLTALRGDGREVIGPTVKEGTVDLQPIGAADELPVGWGLENAAGRSRLVRRGSNRVFDSPVGQASWKRFTFPSRVPMFDWADGSDGERQLEKHLPDVPPYAFVGVRACDLAALRIHDRVLRDGRVHDADYEARRRDNLIVAVECAVAGGTCFCSSMGSGPELSDGFDLGLSELDDGFVVRVGSAAGAAIVDGLGLAPASAAAVEGAAESVRRVRQAMGRPLPMAEVPAALVSSPSHPRWAEVGERCLACANCVLVCPTCFCTNATPTSDLTGQAASSERTWASCFTLGFARVAGGNFRLARPDRYRQWLTHKFGTWWSQFGSSGCVGCGRCISWCPVGIDVREETLAILGPTDSLTPLPAPQPRPIPAGDVRAQIERPWIPVRVAAAVRETADVVTLRLETNDPALLTARPGQFVMAALPAMAAPPISISRFHPDGLELTIRAAGPASLALTQLERGAALSLRGPLGRGWPVEMADGRDVQIVTGGIGLAPLRSLVDALLARRDRIGVIHLAYGARTPVDRIYREWLDELDASRDIEIAQTVDRAGPEWLGRVGVVTQVIDRVMCACDRTVAFVCGPERMMVATGDALRERGVPDERIFVTLERRMDCGVGLCGHCQLGRFFVCHDGPVFSLAELGPALGQEGL
jgi:sulfhydrogenase subunit beta (sulfur reductase)